MSDPTFHGDPTTPQPGEAERAADATDRSPSLAVRVLLVVLSLLIAAVVLGVTGWIIGPRLRRSGGAEGPSPAAGRPNTSAPSVPSAADLVMPADAERVPGSFHPGTSDRMAMATVPGHLEAVRGYFVRQAERKGWRRAVENPSADSKAVTLVFQKGAVYRTITIRGPPAGDECTVQISDPAGQ